MKKAIVVLAVLLMAATAVSAATPTFTDFQSAFTDVANGVSSSLALESSVGLSWSDAWVGQLVDVPPHFGFGITVGAAMIPYASIQNALTTFSGAIPSSVGFMSSIGVPLPTYTVDVRIGGFVLPFDMGFKFGWMPSNGLSSIGVSGISVDYLSLGGDIRLGIIQDRGFLPGLSLGVGYTYMRGNVDVPGVFSGNIHIATYNYNGQPYDLQFTNPSLNFNWSSSVIDAKIQLSKKLLFITPYAGMGVSYGFSNAGGGMASQMQVSTDGGANYHNATQSEIDNINTATGSSYTLQNTSFGVTQSTNGFSVRAFGGFSLDFFAVRLGFGAAYELLTGTMAGMANLRFQL